VLVFCVLSWCVEVVGLNGGPVCAVRRCPIAGVVSDAVLEQMSLCGGMLAITGLLGESPACGSALSA